MLTIIYIVLYNYLVDDQVRSKWSRFLPEHPQCDSHHVKFDPLSSTHKVPNFMGGALPRKDQGDVNYYYVTMLTIFKPWRTPADLKLSTQTWKDAFDSFSFTTEHKIMMSNFNVRYECLDERDDYHKILKQKRKEATNVRLFNPFKGFEEDETDDGEVEALMKELMDKISAVDCSDIQLISGYKSKRNDRDKMKARAILERLNWLGSSDIPEQSGEENGNEECMDMHISTSLTGSHWKNIVQSTKKHLITLRQQSRLESIASIKTNKDGYDGTTPPAPFSQWRRTRDGVVRLLDKSYIFHDYKAQCERDTNIVNSTIAKFSLNKEQTRAFKIVANHACSPSPEQLKMYLGGMGGTGKSQVIKALISMFSSRSESHRFMVVAPTGTAAALLNGSTYHSALGIINRSNSESDDVPIRSESALVLDARERLAGVDYIFLDEVSMISCSDLYNISTRLSKVTGESDEPFGGVNMIFAGDFAQLPPTGGHYLYSHCPTNEDSKKKWMETAIIDDDKLRVALENMRYASCTPEDIFFLKSKIVNNSNAHLLRSRRFRNVSIITSLNNFKDQYNKDGARRFALENGKKIVEFKSIDSLTQLPGVTTSKGRGNRKSNKNRMTEALQKVLWKLDPNATDHIPGMLSICIGMPVMLRNNDATELCITKGQEGIVVGWDSTTGPYNSQVLETLFVRLINPPKPIQIKGLAENVVPIPRSKNPANCLLPDDTRIRVERDQVNVLPNFSMTDYASQGKTRKENVIDLSNSRTFHHMYTSLSRSSDANGTIILTEFDESKITGGIKDGRLRQELRELAILDKITELRHSKKLHQAVTCDMRYPLIHSFLTAEDHSHKERRIKWHESLNPVAGDSLLPDLNDYSAFYTVNKSIRTKLDTILGRESNKNDDRKELLVSMTSNGSNSREELPMEQIRDQIRLDLNRANPLAFPYGHSFIFIHDLVGELFRSDELYGETVLTCDTCDIYKPEHHLQLRELTSVLSNSFLRETCATTYGLRHALYMYPSPTRNLTCDTNMCQVPETRINLVVLQRPYARMP
ncbi:hypothetical protein CC1G_14080 [Coprinopsis cinerea okayama7|uniref:ATP-dependent DNA helicase n=1 Tax=Coprinopsis cinerea (strain Okayama-7 / 130 / ATCC MYA-4618 / FGSC 9003) TaxID=240176 RepID=D6RL98_COPC7|nr:hypothetical protein CC1G_14080 [Coprinopsis cinerea okayama7\|eukprot:XP_002911548.1 hypothetical protein CC1G_14080 [Coprinopsis cinerea okayama7\